MIKIGRVILFIVWLIYPMSGMAGDETVLVVSGNFRIYEEAKEGFKDTFEGKTKEFVFKAERTRQGTKFDQSSIQKTVEHIQNESPKLVVVFGTQALMSVLDVVSEKTPVIISMVKNPLMWTNEHIEQGRPIYGVEPLVSPELVMQTIQTTYPEAKTVGVAYLERSTELVMELSKSANDVGLHLHAEMASTENPLIAIEAMRQDADLFVVVDNAMIESTALDVLLLQRKPIITLVKNKTVVSKGALFGFQPQYRENGRVAGEMANHLLQKKPIDENFTKMKRVSLVVNRKVREQLNTPLPEGFDIDTEFSVISD